MISSRDNEPDVIDLTTSYSYDIFINYPLRPPSPFADDSIWFNTDQTPDTSGYVTWSSPSAPDGNDPVPPPPSASLVRRPSHWRRVLHRLLKRTKSDHRKKNPSTTTEVDRPYHFGVGEITRKDSIVSRTSSKRVHWLDDEEAKLNACHRFVEHLKLFVHSVINEYEDHREEKHLNDCRNALDELSALIDTYEIREKFADLVELARRREKDALLEQQVALENVLSGTVLLPAC